MISAANFMIRKVETLLAIMLLATTTTACMSEENSPTQKETPSTVRHLTEATPQARKVTAMPNSTESTTETTTSTPARPKFRDYIEGGRLKKKIKTDFMKAHSYVVFYESKDEFPNLQAILLSPDSANKYQRISIASFPYEGGMADVKDVFFYDVDKDNAKEAFMIITWKIEHKALGIDAMNYKIFAFDNEPDTATNSLKQLDEIMARFGSGNDGEMEEGPVSFQYKDRESILQALKQ